jgi:FtsH-binding integral membrane protein
MNSPANKHDREYSHATPWTDIGGNHRRSMLPAFAAFGMALTLTMVASIAYTLCFEATTLGGWLPFAILMLAPMVGYAAGRVSIGPGRRNCAQRQTAASIFIERKCN